MLEQLDLYLTAVIISLWRVRRFVRAQSMIPDRANSPTGSFSRIHMASTWGLRPFDFMLVDVYMLHAMGSAEQAAATSLLRHCFQTLLAMLRGYQAADFHALSCTDVDEYELQIQVRVLLRPDGCTGDFARAVIDSDNSIVCFDGPNSIVCSPSESGQITTPEDGAEQTVLPQ
jgi:hypothetical protein